MPRAAGSRLTIRPPRDYLLRRDLCSYGYFLLEPNHWDPATRQFRRVLDTGRRSVSVSIEQPSGVRGGTLVVRAAGTLSEPERAAVRRDVHGVACVRQSCLQLTAQIRFVLNHEHAHVQPPR